MLSPNATTFLGSSSPQPASRSRKTRTITKLFFIRTTSKSQYYDHIGEKLHFQWEKSLPSCKRLVLTMPLTCPPCLKTFVLVHGFPTNNEYVLTGRKPNFSARRIDASFCRSQSQRGFKRFSIAYAIKAPAQRTANPRPL